MTERLSNEYESPVLTEDDKKRISDSLKSIRETVKECCKRAGREDSVTLMAATKTVSVEKINYAISECGLTDIGENRVQELLEKYDMLRKDGVRIHFIGTLQPNKVKYIIDKVFLIHSLDSMSLAREIDKRASAKGIKMDVLIEVNIGSEESKGGIEKDKVIPFANELRSFGGIRLVGLMTMAPKCEDKEDYRGYFSSVRALFDKMANEGCFDTESPILSMGMSQSYDIAVECGSTLIRPGSAVFGNRIYKNSDPK